MANFSGSPDSGLTDLLGGHDPRSAGLSATAYADLADPNQEPAEVDTFGLLAFEPDALGLAVESVNNARANPSVFAGSVFVDLFSEWFEKMILRPTRIDFGNILSAQVRDVELLNNFRNDPRTWSSLNDLTGGEVTTGSVPGLPTVLNPLQSIIIQVSVNVSGAPVIDGDLEFVVDVVTLLLPITGTRVILFPFQPEAPLTEVLQFNTEILTKMDGSEQRVRGRRAPRSLFEFRVFVAENERDRLNAVLYEWQDKIWGTVLWAEGRYPSAAISAPTDTVQVDTRYGDFRVGGLAVIWKDHADYEVFEILSMTDTQLQFTAQVQTSRQANEVLVLPVRTSYMEGAARGNRYPIGPTTVEMRFVTLDNEDLSSVAAFGSYLSKVLIDRQNALAGSTKEEAAERLVEEIEPLSGPPYRRSTWPKSKPHFGLRLLGESLQEVWELRQLMHALSGSFLSFYLGTGRHEMVPVSDISNGSDVIDIEFLDFERFYGSTPAAPRGHLQIFRKDGTRSQHQITAVTQVTPGQVERLTVSPAISPALPAADVARIEFLTLSRIYGNEVQVTHNRVGSAAFDASTIGVQA